MEIHDWDIVCNYEPELERIFQLKNLIHVATDEEKGLSSYEKVIPDYGKFVEL